MQRYLLLVDDEPNVLSALRRCLRRDGYEIHTAESGAEGLKLLEQYPFAVVVSDQRMPVMPGSEFLAKVMVLRPQTIRIMLSGYSEVQSLVDTINSGAAWKFLFKPWDDEVLRGQVAKAFELAESQQIMARLNSELLQANTALASLSEQMQTTHEQSLQQLQVHVELLEDLLAQCGLQTMLVGNGLATGQSHAPTAEALANSTEWQGAPQHASGYQLFYRRVK